MKNVSGKPRRENQTHNNVFSAIVPFVRLCGLAGQATEDIMANAHCMLYA
jgi:hypothetical protein